MEGVWSYEGVSQSAAELTCDDEDRLLSSDGRLDVGVGLGAQSLDLAPCNTQILTLVHAITN